MIRKAPGIHAIAVLSAQLAIAAVADAQSTKLAALGPAGPIQKVQSDFGFTEGPASDNDGNLYFTDIPQSRIYKLTSDGKITVFQEGSGHANGLMFAANGELIKCEMDGRLTALNVQTKQQRVLVGEFENKRFNAPNDLVIDAAGGIYFTDPHFRAPEPLPQGKTAVYYLSADGTVARLIDGLNAPNGVILSPDEKTLYVIPSGQAEMMAYPVKAPGQIGAGRVFCTLRQKAGQNGGGGDGLTVDELGNLYITSALGLQVYSPQGELLGILEFPEQPANVTFGGPDRRTLYVTARTSLYSVKMNVSGHRFARQAP